MPVECGVEIDPIGQERSAVDDRRPARQRAKLPHDKLEEVSRW